jgi:hypothetical protein
MYLFGGDGEGEIDTPVVTTADVESESELAKEIFISLSNWNSLIISRGSQVRVTRDRGFIDLTATGGLLQVNAIELEARGVIGENYSERLNDSLTDDFTDIEDGFARVWFKERNGYDEVVAVAWVLAEHGDFDDLPEFTEDGWSEIESDVVVGIYATDDFWWQENTSSPTTITNPRHETVIVPNFVGMHVLDDFDGYEEVMRDLIYYNGLTLNTSRTTVNCTGRIILTQSIAPGTEVDYRTTINFTFGTSTTTEPPNQPCPYFCGGRLDCSGECCYYCGRDDCRNEECLANCNDCTSCGGSICVCGSCTVQCMC